MARNEANKNLCALPQKLIKSLADGRYRPCPRPPSADLDRSRLGYSVYTSAGKSRKPNSINNAVGAEWEGGLGGRGGRGRARA